MNLSSSHYRVNKLSTCHDRHIVIAWYCSLACLLLNLQPAHTLELQNRRTSNHDSTNKADKYVTHHHTMEMIHMHWPTNLRSLLTPSWTMTCWRWTLMPESTCCPWPCANDRMWTTLDLALHWHLMCCICGHIRHKPMLHAVRFSLRPS
jgi:hypothetical protein